MPLGAQSSKLAHRPGTPVVVASGVQAEVMTESAAESVPCARLVVFPRKNTTSGNRVRRVSEGSGEQEKKNGGNWLGSHSVLS